MTSNKIVWLVCNNVQPPEIDTHLRHQKFAQYLKKDGYEVYIIGASYLHYSKVNLIKGKEKYIEKIYPDLHYFFIRVSDYKKNTGLRRLYSNFQFAWNLFKLRKELPQPSIIVHNTRIPCDIPIYWTAKRLKAKYITETWDLWPLSFVTLGLISPRNPLLKFFYKIEESIYYHADRCIFTLAGCKEYIKDHKWDTQSGGRIDLNKVFYINNGIDIDDFNEQKEKYQLSIPELTEPSTFKILYLGSIGHVNAVDMIIDTAKLFVDYPNVVFLIFGKGEERKRLEKRVINENVNNVKFLNEWVEIKYVPYIISCADINLMNYSHLDTYKYGGSQGKLFQYLAAGKPIVSNNEMGHDIINYYGAGLSKTVRTSDQYKDLLCSIITNKKLYMEMSIASRNAANDFDFKSLYKLFKGVLDSVVES